MANFNFFLIKFKINKFVHNNLYSLISSTKKYFIICHKHLVTNKIVLKILLFEQKKYYLYVTKGTIFSAVDQNIC